MFVLYLVLHITIKYDIYTIFMTKVKHLFAA